MIYLFIYFWNALPWSEQLVLVSKCLSGVRIVKLLLFSWSFGWWCSWELMLF